MILPTASAFLKISRRRRWLRRSSPLLGETPESVSNRAAGDRQVHADDVILPIKEAARAIPKAGLSRHRQSGNSSGAIVGVAGLAGAGVRLLFAVLRHRRVSRAGVMPLSASTAGGKCPYAGEQHWPDVRQNAPKTSSACARPRLGATVFVLRRTSAATALIGAASSARAGSMHLPVGALSGAISEGGVRQMDQAAPSAGAV